MFKLTLLTFTGKIKSHMECAVNTVLCVRSESFSNEYDCIMVFVVLLNYETL